MGRTANVHPKDGVSRLNFPEGFGSIFPNKFLIAGDSADLTNAIQANDRIAVSSTRNGNCGKFCQHIFLSFNLSLLLTLNPFSANMPSYMTNSARFNPAEIVGGQDAPSPIPWQIIKEYGCGGTILDSTTILSAAHCYYSIGEWIRAGSLKRYSGGQVCYD